jgi:hypothetical protein
MASPNFYFSFEKADVYSMGIMFLEMMDLKWDYAVEDDNFRR